MCFSRTFVCLFVLSCYGTSVGDHINSDFASIDPSLDERLAETNTILYRNLREADSDHEHEHDDQHHTHFENSSHHHHHLQDVGERLPSTQVDIHPTPHYHQRSATTTREITWKVWLYSCSAVAAISAVGLLAVVIIPIMVKWYYEILLQFSVSLAIGSLSGDAVLHLMPHAILDGEEIHDHSPGETHSNGMEMQAVWRGLAVLGGIFVSFIAERLLGVLMTNRRQRTETKLSRSALPVPREDGTNNGGVGEKLAQPKKDSYDHVTEKDEKETMQMLQCEPSPSKRHEVGFHGRSSFSLEAGEMGVAYRPDCDVVISEHHGHGHAHSHEIPQTVSAVAWMVILGDGLHNFCDGLAIGAAFASGDADGISTTIAVFCHELPHELGDFAMLLKTGMTVRQALFYNFLSSVLCFLGMVIGVSLGNVYSATNWVFAGTAGMFLYIALVDMLPELSSPRSGSGRSALWTLAVQVLGVSVGISVMLFIALYEHDLHSIVS